MPCAVTFFPTGDNKTMQSIDLCCVLTSDLLFPPHPPKNTHHSYDFQSLSHSMFTFKNICYWCQPGKHQQLHLCKIFLTLLQWLLLHAPCSLQGNARHWFLTKINLNRHIRQSLALTKSFSVTYWSVFSGYGTCQKNIQWAATGKKKIKK